MNLATRITWALAALSLVHSHSWAQSLLFEDDFEDGVIDTNLWEVWLPFGNSSVVETGGVLRIENRGWLLSAPGLAGLDQDLVLEGEFAPEIQSGTYADNWAAWVYANNAPSGNGYHSNTDGLYLAWWGQSSDLGINGTGSIQASTVGGVATGGAWKGFRLSTSGGLATLEMWDVANPTDAVIYQTAFTKLPGAGSRIIFYNREAIGFNHVTLLDNVRVYLAQDCNSNGVSDSQDISNGTSLDCDLNGVPDECDLAGDPDLDCDGNGSLDSCEIDADGSLDLNGDGVLDACECAASSYCLPAGNSAGTSAIIGFQGSLSIASSDFALTATGAPPLKFGLFFYGATQGQQLLGEGMLCVAAPVQRVQPILLTDSDGSASLVLDLTQPPFVDGPFAVSPHSTWNFQFWYRDPLGGPAGFNFSDALMVSFCP